MPGDVNNIPTITSADIVYLINYIFDKDRPGAIPPCIDPDPGTCWPIVPLCRGDMSGDGRLDAIDVVWMVHYVFDQDRPAMGCVDPDPGSCWLPIPTEVCCKLP